MPARGHSTQAGPKASRSANPPLTRHSQRENALRETSMSGSSGCIQAVWPLYSEKNSSPVVPIYASLLPTNLFPPRLGQRPSLRAISPLHQWQICWG